MSQIYYSPLFFPLDLTLGFRNEEISGQAPHPQSLLAHVEQPLLRHFNNTVTCITGRLETGRPEELVLDSIPGCSHA